jgi:hypothetical protein
VDLYKVLVLDLVVVAAIPSASAVTGISPLLDFHEQHFKRQSFVWEDARKMDKLFENIKQRSLFWTAAAGDDLAAFPFALHEVLADDDWFDDQYVVFFEQHFDFVADGRERRELDFDELVAADDIDAVAAQALLGEPAASGVTFFQLAVEGGFHCKSLGVSR